MESSLLNSAQLHINPPRAQMNEQQCNVTQMNVNPPRAQMNEQQCNVTQMKEMPGKTHWCKCCHKKPPEEDDNKFLLQLEALLPPDYDHSVCSFVPSEQGGFTASLKLRAQEEQEVYKWLEDFQKSSKTTWRVWSTYPKCQRVNKFRVDMRCQHAVHGHKRLTKKTTFCPAFIYLVLKQDLFRNQKTRSGDSHLSNNLTFSIRLRNIHNHELSTPESLRHRDVSKETVFKLETLFLNGHTPSSALKALKNELRAQTGEDGFQAAILDHAVCPDLGFCYRRYYKLFPEKKRTRKRKPKEGEKIGETTGEITEVFIGDNGTDSHEETFEALQALQEAPVQFSASASAPAIFTVVDVGSVIDTEIRLRGMFQDLIDKLKSDQAFVEPVRSMLCSYETMSSDKEKLTLALKTFGKMRKEKSEKPAKGKTGGGGVKRPCLPVQKVNQQSHNIVWVQPMDAQFITSASVLHQNTHFM